MNKIIQMLNYNSICDTGEEIFVSGIMDIMFYELNIESDGYATTQVLNDEDFENKISKYMTIKL